MMITDRLVLGMFLVTLVSAPSPAQTPKSQLPPSMLGVSPSWQSLLANQSVRAEIKVSEEQARKLDDYASKSLAVLQERLKSIEGLPPEERAPKMIEAGKGDLAESDRFYTEALTPAQIKRVKQINVQRLGFNAFGGPEARETLKLTDEQKAKYSELIREYQDSARRIMAEAQGDRSKGAKKMEELRFASLNKMLSTLTAEQNEAWKTMAGPAFEIKMEPRPRGN